ncbi:hypothetical protein BZB76_4968 [Actinomadura pelletieri DSM 43383]|uniref:DUF1449 family protein n=1 Tax=Actinomadura pelletieri DSM 43383 TaxID=1120940 RepID=A0A495QJ44_9ACTN|nr:hypothetical protein [Actinomadura pelletieri]RKS72151.1 hypothetical protein BZB76_4968 [Actinomadura pelletieri DSM 43383]
MGEFIDAALGFPTALFTFSLLVVTVYWTVALLGGLGTELPGTGGDVGDAFGGAEDGAEDGFVAERLAFLGLGGVPVTVVLSLLIALAWFVSLAGTALFDGTVARTLVLPVALVAAWLGTRVTVLPLRRVFQGAVEASLRDFVGLPCVIRTGRVGPDFGQAEVTAADGSSAIVQVRQPAMDIPVAGLAKDTVEGAVLTTGSRALIFDFDPEGRFFWVMPHDAAYDRPEDLAR